MPNKVLPRSKQLKIPKAIREQVWIYSFGKVYEHSCYIKWCKNVINVYDYHIGHDIPKSKGGTLDVLNLKPICARCNTSMSDNFTIYEWNKLSQGESKKKRWFHCLTKHC